MPKRILFLIPSLEYGGAELLMVQQVRWLQTNGWTVYVCVLSSHIDPGLLNTLGISRDQILLLNSANATLNTASIFFAVKNQLVLSRFAKQHSIQVIIAHLPLSHFWSRLLKLQLPAARLIIYHHSMQYQANPLDTLGKKVFNWFHRQLASRTDDLTICISNAVKKDIECNFVLKNPEVLYNAVPDKGTSSHLQSRAKAADDSSILKLILPGRLHPSKGHLFFLQVFNQLIRTKDRKLQLLIAGGGPLENDIVQFIHQKGLEKHVIITGFLSNDALLELLSQSDIVIIPSISEGLGLVAIEALMFGKTIIASDAGGLKEVIQHKRNGYSFKAGDEEDCFNVCQFVLGTFPDSLLTTDLLRADYKSRFSFDSYMSSFSLLLHN